MPQQTLIRDLLCSGLVASSCATHSDTAFCVAHADATEPLPMPAGKVQLLIEPGSLTMSMQRSSPPGAQGMSPQSIVRTIGMIPPRSPARVQFAKPFDLRVCAGEVERQPVRPFGHAAYDLVDRPVAGAGAVLVADRVPGAVGQRA